MRLELIVDVTVEAANWDRAVADLEVLCQRVVRGAACHVVDLSGMDLDGVAEISVLFADDARVQILNREWRGQDKPTNVLSFPGEDFRDGLAQHEPRVPRLLGDVVVALETTQGEAGAQHKTLVDHLSHLLVHGVLHVLGFDHTTEEHAGEMEALEVEILADLGVPCPYLDRI